MHRDQVLGEAGYESDEEYKGRFFRPYYLGAISARPDRPMATAKVPNRM